MKAEEYQRMLSEASIQESLVYYCRIIKMDRFLVNIPNQQAIFGLLESLKAYIPSKLRDKWKHKLWGYWEQLKRMGFRKGATDLFLAIPRGKYHGLWIEVKKKGNKPSEAQEEFMEDMRSQGYRAEWINSVDKGLNLIEDYLLTREIINE